MGLTCPNCNQELGGTDWCPTCIRHNDPSELCGCPECDPPERDEPDDDAVGVDCAEVDWDDVDGEPF